MGAGASVSSCMARSRDERDLSPRYAESMSEMALIASG